MNSEATDSEHIDLLALREVLERELILLLEHPLVPEEFKNVFLQRSEELPL